MPDGDIFQRSLRGTGKGWVAVFRLCAFDGSLDGLAGKISKACADNLRQIPRETIESCLDALLSTVEEERIAMRLNSVRSQNPFLKLDQELRMIRSNKEFELTNILRESAQSVFASVHMRAGELTSSEISNAFGETVVDKIFDNRASKVRTHVMKASGRDINEQFEFEAKLRSSIAGIGRKLINDFCAGKKLRAPAIRRRKPRKSASELLNQSIQVIA